MISQLNHVVIHNIVAILTLAAEASGDVDSYSFEEMSRIKRNPNDSGWFYIYMKTQFNMLTGAPSKVPDWETRYFFVKIGKHW